MVFRSVGMGDLVPARGGLMLREDEDIAYRVAAVVRLADGETSKASRLKLAGGWPL